MKYLDFQSLSHLAELCQRQNGKTSEAVKATLNRLMDIDGIGQIMFISYNSKMVDYVRKIFTEKLEKSPSGYRIKITVNNNKLLRFESCTGEKSIRFSTFESMPLAANGLTLDDVIFDIDPSYLFDRGYPTPTERFLEIYQAIAPTLHKNKRSYA